MGRGAKGNKKGEPCRSVERDRCIWGAPRASIRSGADISSICYVSEHNCEVNALVNLTSVVVDEMCLRCRGDAKSKPSQSVIFLNCNTYLKLEWQQKKFVGGRNIGGEEKMLVELHDDQLASSLA